MTDVGIFLDGTEVKTLCYLTRVNPESAKRQILLARHRKQKKWNGIGGKVGDKPEFENETVEEGAIREGIEELGVKFTKLEKKAVIDFLINGEDKITVHVFLVESWEGNIQGLEVDDPTWFDEDELPLNEMWESDTIWLTKLLKSDGFIEGSYSIFTGQPSVENRFEVIKS